MLDKNDLDQLAKLFRVSFREEFKEAFTQAFAEIWEHNLEPAFNDIYKKIEELPTRDM